MMSFGKRRSATPALPARQQILPTELLDSDGGDRLRAAGLQPDAESNFETRDPTDARLARDKAAHAAKWAQVSREIAARTDGGAVEPFFLIPEPCWDGETGTFLLARLQLSPYEDWNVAFLPTDERSAAILGLPRHPLGEAMVFARDAEEFLRARMAQMDAIRAECDRTRDFARFKQKQDDLKEMVRAFAAWLLERYGEVWKVAAARAG